MLIIGGSIIQMCIENYVQPLSTYQNVILLEEEIEHHGHVIFEALLLSITNLPLHFMESRLV